MTPLERNTEAMNRLAAAIEAMVGSRPKRQNIAKAAMIQAIVSEHFRITPERMVSPIRTQDIARPRQIAMALCRKYLNYTTPMIGRSFRRDHTTVLAAVKRVEELRRTDERFADDYEMCEAVVHATLMKGSELE